MIHWTSFSDFIAMGGYATYVWGSFGVTGLIMIFEPIVAIRNQRGLIARLKRQMRAESRAESRIESRTESRNENRTAAQ